MFKILIFVLFLLCFQFSSSSDLAGQEGPKPYIKKDYEYVSSLNDLLEINRLSRRNFYIKGNPIGTGRYSNVFFSWKVDLSPETKNKIGEETLVIDPSLLNLTDHQISILKGSPVALKELKNIQEWKILREVSILKLLNGYSEDDLDLKDPEESYKTQGKKSIVKLLDIVKYHHPVRKIQKGGVPKKHIGLVMEYIDNEQFYSLLPGLSYRDLQNYMRQLLEGLKYANSLGVFHRDIKPQNIVIDKNRGLLKIIDWGLAEYYSEDEADFSPRVASKCYKAPELLLGIRNYDFSVDSWSVGCLFSQMLFRLGTTKTNYFTGIFSKYPKNFVGIFLKNSLSPDALFPGWDNNDQLVKIGSLLGGDNIIYISNKYNGTISDELTLSYLKRTRKIFNSTTTSFTDPRTFEFLITEENQDLVTFQALDLLSKLLTLDFKSRIHPKDALKHPFFTLNPSQHLWITKVPDPYLRSSIYNNLYFSYKKSGSIFSTDTKITSSNRNKDFCPSMSPFPLINSNFSII
ncbi:casein kinase alpha subunit [Cryptosporidium ubiquitum]|uniref:non-specific serine/threonine protein kinase n=1 Tax=Cryptosporidium ubiquitum TaxID=857276 RepID=A0A1J4MIC1_9CRYT|nr:casein kinase alpha subunit [Cryptosporidium ubiquitum]OII74002.1 casein kinase alpha subunit [Cryptosporidium ubiquitum]